MEAGDVPFDVPFAEPMTSNPSPRLTATVFCVQKSGLRSFGADPISWAVRLCGADGRGFKRFELGGAAVAQVRVQASLQGGRSSHRSLDVPTDETCTKSTKRTDRASRSSLSEDGHVPGSLYPGMKHQRPEGTRPRKPSIPPDINPIVSQAEALSYVLRRSRSGSGGNAQVLSLLDSTKSIHVRSCASLPPHERHTSAIAAKHPPPLAHYQRSSTGPVLEIGSHAPFSPVSSRGASRTEGHEYEGGYPWAT